MSRSIYCPHCHKFTELSNRGGYNNQTGNYWMGECNSCHKLVLVNDSTHKIYPMPLPKPIDERIPHAIKSDFEESITCFSIAAYRASAVMARRALQSICLDKGAKEKDKLEKQIDDLFSQGIITKDLRDWAHEVRFVGNDAAHPKKPENDQPVSEEDAKDVLDLLEQFCQVLYVAPAIAEGRRKSREKT